MINFDSIKKENKNIDTPYNFCKVVGELNGHDYSRSEILFYFDILWEQTIPEEHLYKTYNELLNCNNYLILRNNEWYKTFYSKKILKKISEINKHDTIINQELASLADEDGYLTVYHGHCRKSLRYADSWTLSRERSFDLGVMDACLGKSSEFTLVSGMVNLNDVVTFLPNNNEIIVLQKSVKSKTEEVIKIDGINTEESFNRRGSKQYKGIA